MRKRLNYLMLTAAIAMLAMALVPDLGRSRSITNADFNAEVREIEAFVTDLGKYDDQVILLKKKAQLTADETKTLAQERDCLKARLFGIENAFREIADKLKGDGRWDGLDAEILRAVTDSKVRRVIEQGGGARKILEDAQNLLSSADEISSWPLVGTSPECSTPGACVPKIIAVSYDLSTVLFKDSMACKIARGALIATNAKPGSPTSIKAWCLCVEMPTSRNETLAQCMQINSSP